MYKNYEFEAQVFRDFSFILCLNDLSCDMGMGGYAGIKYSNVDPAFRKKIYRMDENGRTKWMGKLSCVRGIYQFLSKKLPKPPKPSN